MAETHASTARVAILAFPEVTASVLYGLYDILLSAGRDWGMIDHEDFDRRLLSLQLQAKLV